MHVSLFTCSTTYLNHIYAYIIESVCGFSNYSIYQSILAPQPYCLALCNPMDYSPPCSSVHGILLARILECVAIPFSTGSSWPRDWTQVSRIVGRFFTIWAAGKPRNTGMGSLSFLQRFFPTQESNQSLLHYRQILYQLSYQGSRDSQSNFYIFIPISQESWSNVKGNM